MLKLKEKVAIITGAGQGIGLTYARCLASEGAKVVIADVIDCNAVSRKLMNEIPNSDIFAIKVDVSDENSTEKMVQDTFKRYGRIDILVNNAAIFGKLVPGPFEEIKVSEWDQLMAVNVKGPWLCSKAVSPIMRKQKSGKIINIASGTLFKGTPNLLHYVSSKGEIVTMIQKAKNVYNGIIINAAAYTHTSVAILDALLAIKLPTIEVHITNIYNREEFREKSLISKAANGIICGFGVNGYIMALDSMKEIFNK